MERSHQSPGNPRRLGQHLLSLRIGTFTQSVVGVTPAPAGAKSGLWTLDPRTARLVGSLLSPAVGPNLEGADSPPQSYSICMTVLSKNWVISKLPVPPPRALSVQQICCSQPSLASTLQFPQKRRSRVAKNCVFPAPQLRLCRPCPPSHLPTLVSPQKHTHAHTRVPFPYFPPLPTSHGFPCSPPGSQGWKEPARSSVLLSPPRTVDWIFSVTSLTRYLHPLREHLQGWGVDYLPRQPSAFGLLCCISSTRRRFFCVPSMASHLLCLLP